MSKLKEINSLAREIREEGEKWQDAQKRAKEIINATSKEESLGVGDAVEAITKATGIKAAVDFVFDKLGKDCGCDARKESLNSYFSKKNVKAPECFTESELEQYNIFRKDFDGEKLTPSNQRFIAELWAAKFRKTVHYPCPTCSGSGRIFNVWIADLNQIADSYEG